MNVEKNNAKNVKKVFTKNDKKDIMNENYNLPRVNYNVIYKGEGLFMNNIVLDEVKKLSKKYSRKEKIFIKMFEEGTKEDFNINEIREIINEFENNNICY